MIRSLVVLAAFAAPAAGASPSPDPASLAVPPAETLRARELIRKLASDKYRERDKATRELRAMGRFALPALTAAAAEPDAEVRTRTASLVPQASAADTAARLVAFLADTDGKFDHGLPAWDKFRAAAGADDPARRLFADLVSDPDNRELLDATRAPAADLGNAVRVRRQQLQAKVNPPVPVPSGQSRMPAVPDIAALLFAESLVSEKLAPFDGFQYHVTNFLYQPAGREAAGGAGPTGPAFRRLTLTWLDTRDAPAGLMAAMNLAKALDLGPGEPARHAAKLLGVADAQPWYKAQALGVVARAGGGSHLPAVTRLFADDAMLVNGNAGQPQIQTRDFALAMALLMTGQDPAAYGLEVANSTEPAKYTPMTYRFPDDAAGPAAAKRDAAFAKWKQWDDGRKNPKLKDTP